MYFEPKCVRNCKLTHGLKITDSTTFSETVNKINYFSIIFALEIDVKFAGTFGLFYQRCVNPWVTIVTPEHKLSVKHSNG